MTRWQTNTQFFYNKFEKFNWPCYECSQYYVCLNSFDCVFDHKEIRCANKTKIKNTLQYTNKKLSLPGDKIIYAPEENLKLK